MHWIAADATTAATTAAASTTSTASDAVAGYKTAVAGYKTAAAVAPNLMQGLVDILWMQFPSPATECRIL